MNINGQNIELTAIEPDDYKRLEQILNEPQVKKYLFAQPSKIEKTAFGQWLKVMRSDKRAYHFAVRQRHDAAVVGICAYQDIDYRNGSVALWAVIAPELVSKGYTEQALELLVQNAFNQMRMVHISLMCLSGDEVCKRGALQAGFTLDMVQKSRIIKEDKRLDLELYSLIKQKGSG